MKIEGIEIEINSVYERGLREELTSRISFLFSILQGTIPMNRAIGLPERLIDLKSFGLRAQFTVAAIELIETYEPRVSVDSIDFIEDDFGKSIPKVVIVYHGDN